MKVIAVMLILLPGLLSFQANAEQQSQKLLLSYVNHPQVIERYIPLIEAVYDELDIDVVFKDLGMERALMAADSGLSDGDVVRIKYATERFDNIILIEPALSTAEMYLICQQQLPCDFSVLQNPDNVIAATTPAIPHLLHQFIDINPNFYALDKHEVLIDLMKLQRFSYAVFPIDKGEVLPDIELNMKKHLLFEFRIYHILNKKHQALVPAVSEVLAEKLALLQGQKG